MNVSKLLPPLFVLLLTILMAPAKEPQPAGVYSLWPQGVPDDWRIEQKESAVTGKDGVTRVRHVSEPTLSYFPPDGSTKSRQAVIICPGGGYNILAFNHEGTLVADFLAMKGYHAFVLKYRLPRKDDPSRWHVGLQDAQRAISLVRHRAGQFGIDPNKVGIMGFSAGGHLSIMTSTSEGKRNYGARDEIDKQDCVPSFTALIYPAYIVKDRKSLEFRPEIKVSPKTPATFMVQTSDDSQPVEGSLAYYWALKKKGVSAHLFVYDRGGHGYGITKGKENPVAAWPERLADWLADRDARVKE